MTTTIPGFQMLPIASIDEHTRNARHELGDLGELTLSIAEIGVLEPIIVAPGSTGKGEGRCPECDQVKPTNGGDLIVEHEGASTSGLPPCPGGGQPAADAWHRIAGARRMAAAALAGLTTIPAVIRHDLKSQADQLIAMAVENLQRSDLTPVEEAEVYDQLQLFGYKPAQIAKKTGRSKSIVDRRLALMKLDAGVRDLVQAHDMTLADAEALVEFAGDKAATKRLEKALGTVNWSWTLQQERGKVKDAKDARAQRSRLMKDGVTIVPEPTQEDLSAADGPRMLAEWGGWGRIKADPAEHAKTCEHHAAVEPTSGRVTYLCLQPSSHPAVDDDDDLDEDQGLTPEDRAEHEAKRAAHQAFAEDVRTAAGVRTEWIRQYTVGGKLLTPAQRDFLLRYALLVTVGREEYFENDATKLLAWFDLEVIYPDDAGYEARSDADLEAIRAQIEGRDPHVLWLALVAADAENTLAQSWVWQNSEIVAEQAVPWLQFLTDMGYQISEWETEQLAAAVAAGKVELDDDVEEAAV